MRQDSLCRKPMCRGSRGVPAQSNGWITPRHRNFRNGGDQTPFATVQGLPYVVYYETQGPWIGNFISISLLAWSPKVVSSSPRAQNLWGKSSDPVFLLHRHKCGGSHKRLCGVHHTCIYGIKNVVYSIAQTFKIMYSYKEIGSWLCQPNCALFPHTVRTHIIA